MKRCVAFYLCCFLFQISFAQINEQELLDKCREFSAYPDSLIKFGTELTTSPDSFYKGEGYFAIGLGEYRRQHLEEAKDYFLRSLRVIDIAENYTSYMRVYSNYGIVHYRLSEHQKGDSIFLNQLKIASEQNDSLRIGSSYNQLCISSKNAGNYDQAIEYAEKALFFFDDNWASQIHVYTNIGVVYALMDQHSEANKWFYKALKSAQKNGAKVLEARSAGNLSLSLGSEGKADSSLYYSKLALNKYEQLGHTMGIMSSFNHVARSYMALKNYQKAEEYIDKALALFEENKSSGVKYAEFLITKAKLRTKAGKPEEALEYIERSFSETDSSKKTAQWMGLLFLKSEILEENQEHKNALESYKQALDLKTKLEKKQNVEKIQQVVVEYQLIGKEAQINDLRKNNKEWKSWLYSAIGILLILLLILYLIYRKYYKAKTNLSNQEAELELLRSYIVNLQNKSEQRAEHIKLLLKNKSLINSESIIYAKSDGHYIDIYTSENEKPEIERESLKQFFDRLPQQLFVQIHRSYIVNVDQIQSVFSSKIILKDGSELPLSRKYKDSLHQLASN